jgi:hypothetical protein
MYVGSDSANPSGRKAEPFSACPAQITFWKFPARSLKTGRAVSSFAAGCPRWVARLPRQGLQASSAIPLDLQDGTVAKEIILGLGLDQLTPLCLPKEQLQRIALTGHSLKTDAMPKSRMDLTA